MSSIEIAPVRIARPFDTLVSRLTARAVRKEDFFQEAVSAGLDMVDMDTHLRFCLGDVACLIEGRYGADEIGTFASHVKKARSTLYGYAAVSRYYSVNVRASWLDESALSWSHFQRAMRLGDLDASLELLEECAGEAWSVDQLAREIALRNGKSPHTHKIVGTAVFTRHGGGWLMRGMDGLVEGVNYRVTAEEE